MDAVTSGTLLGIYKRLFLENERLRVQAQFEKLATAYPDEAATELWLTAILDVYWSEYLS